MSRNFLVTTLSVCFLTVSLQCQAEPSHFAQAVSRKSAGKSLEIIHHPIFDKVFPGMIIIQETEEMTPPRKTIYFKIENGVNMATHSFNYIRSRMDVQHSVSDEEILEAFLRLYYWPDDPRIKILKQENMDVEKDGFLFNRRAIVRLEPENQPRRQLELLIRFEEGQILQMDEYSGGTLSHSVHIHHSLADSNMNAVEYIRPISAYMGKVAKHPLLSKVFPNVEFGLPGHHSIGASKGQLSAQFDNGKYNMPQAFNVLYNQMDNRSVATEVERIKAMILFMFWEDYSTVRLYNLKKTMEQDGECSFNATIEIRQSYKTPNIKRFYLKILMDLDEILTVEAYREGKEEFSVTPRTEKLHHPVLKTVFPGVYFKEERSDTAKYIESHVVGFFNQEKWIMPDAFNMLYEKVAGESDATVRQRMEAFVLLTYRKDEQQLKLLTIDDVKVEREGYNFNYRAYWEREHSPPGSELMTLYFCVDGAKIVRVDEYINGRRSNIIKPVRKTEEFASSIVESKPVRQSLLNRVFHRIVIKEETGREGGVTRKHIVGWYKGQRMIFPEAFNLFHASPSGGYPYANADECIEAFTRLYWRIDDPAMDIIKTEKADTINKYITYIYHVTSPLHAAKNGAEQVALVIFLDRGQITQVEAFRNNQKVETIFPSRILYVDCFDKYLVKTETYHDSLLENVLPGVQFQRETLEGNPLSQRLVAWCDDRKLIMPEAFGLLYKKVEGKSHATLNEMARAFIRTMQPWKTIESEMIIEDYNTEGYRVTIRPSPFAIGPEDSELRFQILSGDIHRVQEYRRSEPRQSFFMIPATDMGGLYPSNTNEIRLPAVTKSFPGIKFREIVYRFSTAGETKYSVAWFDNRDWGLPQSLSLLYGKVEEKSIATAEERIEAYVLLSYWSKYEFLKISSIEKKAKKIGNVRYNYRVILTGSWSGCIAAGSVKLELWIHYTQHQIQIFDGSN